MNILLIKLFQIFLSALLPPILFFLGERIFGPKTGLLAALICLVYPPFIALPSTLVVDAFLVPWIFLLLLLIVFWRDSLCFWKTIVLGVMAGVSLLTKMRSLAFLLPLWGWLLLPIIQVLFSPAAKREERKRNQFLFSKLLLISLMIGICLLVISPWVFRNYQITGSLSLEHNFGYNFWIGNNPNANVLGKYSSTEIRYPRPAELVARLNLAKNDHERDRIFLKEGLQFWKSHPWQGLWLTLKKMVFFWWIDTINPRTQSLFYIFPALCISLSALAGLFYPGLLWKGVGGVLLCVLGLHYLSVILTFYIPRLRLSVEPVLFLYAAAFWVQLMCKGQGRRLTVS